MSALTGPSLVSNVRPRFRAETTEGGIGCHGRILIIDCLCQMLSGPATCNGGFAGEVACCWFFSVFWRTVMSRSPNPGCRVVRPGGAFAGKQGLDYFEGYRRGNGRLHRHLHASRDHAARCARPRRIFTRPMKRAIYVLSGEAHTGSASGSKNTLITRAEIMLYIPPGVPHLPANLSHGPLHGGHRPDGSERKRERRAVPRARRARARLEHSGKSHQRDRRFLACDKVRHSLRRRLRECRCAAPPVAPSLPSSGSAVLTAGKGSPRTNSPWPSGSSRFRPRSKPRPRVSVKRGDR